MKKFVRESLYESPFNNDIDDEVDLPPEIENDEDVVVEDDWETPEEEDEIADEVNAIDASDMEVDEIEIDDDSSYQSSINLENILDLELKSIEVDREPIQFKNKNTKEIINGIIMAKLNNGNYIFKTENGMRKFNVKDIILLENQQYKGNKLNEIMKDGYQYEYVDYLFDIATFLMLHPENVQAVLNIHNVNDEEEAKIEITNELEDNDQIYGTKAMYDAGIEAEEAALKIVNQYQG
jgi:hypothetical protein